MSFDKPHRLISLLFSRTEEGNLKWQDSADDRGYQVSFPNYSIVVDAYNDPSEDQPEILLRIMNNEGQEIDRYFAARLPKQTAVELGQIYDIARRTALGVETALDELIGELQTDAEKEVPF